MQPTLKQILEWGSCTAAKASRAPFQSFLSAARTPSFQRLMASAKDMVEWKPGGRHALAWPGGRWEGSERGSPRAEQPPGLTFLAWCSEWAPASLQTT